MSIARRECADDAVRQCFNSKRKKNGKQKDLK
jgi:hypothetical protein